MYLKETDAPSSTLGNLGTIKCTMTKLKLAMLIVIKHIE